MRELLAALMTAALLVVTTTDRVACADGCTDEVQHQGPATPTPSVCGLCHGWNGPLIISVNAPVSLPVVSFTALSSRELPAHVTPLDHPPKLA